MTVPRRLVDGVLIVDLTGHMTGLDIPGRMKEQVTTALAAGHRQIVLNLSQVSFVDSSFIGELVTCCLLASRAGGSVKLASPVRRVQETLLITHLSTMVESFETESAAVASFLKPGN